MSFTNKLKKQLDRKGMRAVVAPAVSHLAKRLGHGTAKIFWDDGVWIHETSHGYFAYHQPYLRLNLAHLDAVTRENFFWGYAPRPGDIVMDIGAGAGEETLTFSQAVGESGKVICVEAHPRTFHCLEKLIEYNRLRNVIAIHGAVTEPGCDMATIGDGEEYLANRLNVPSGIAVPGSTVDEICGRLGVSRIDFLKMNIEGAEQFAIQGMSRALSNTAVLCISCHDFLAKNGNSALRTRDTVQQFLRQSGFTAVLRDEAGQPAYLRDQVWGYNEARLNKMAG